MAKVQRSKSKSTKKKKPKAKLKPSRIDIELPTDLEEPSGAFEDFNLLVHGEKKIGKTSLALQGGKVLLLQHDPKQRAYPRMEIPLRSWREFRHTLKLLQKQITKKKYPYDRVVVDGADVWYQNCMEYVCKLLGITHPEDMGWGKAWAAVRGEFSECLRDLLDLPCGVWFLCHSTWKEVTDEDGDKAEKLLPRLGSQAEEILNGMVDGWFCYDYRKRSRVLILEGDQYTGAGQRMDYPGLNISEILKRGNL